MFFSNSDFILQGSAGRLLLPSLSIGQALRVCILPSCLLLTHLERQFSFLGGHPRPLLAGVSLLQHQPVSGKCYTVQSGHLIHETCSGAKFCASPHPLMAEAILGVSFTSGLDSLLF